LKEANISRPDSTVLVRIKMNNAMLRQAMRSVDDACVIYRSYRYLPKTATRHLITDTLDMKVNGPAMDNPKILAACDGRGRMCIVKVLKCPVDSLLSHADRGKEIAMEIKAVEILNLEKPTLAFVTASLKTLTIPSEDAKYFSVGSFHVLVMPTYAATVATSPGFKTAVLATEGRRILGALAFMHSKNLVHMDVKGHNIFVDYLGNWFLGDFGSCTFTNNPVTSCSELFYFEKVLGKPALPKYDFYMLMITLLIETLPDKHNFASELKMKGSFMNEEIVEEKVLCIVAVGDNFGVLMGKLLELSR